MSSSVVSVCDIPEGTFSLPGVGCIDFRQTLDKSVPKVYLHVDLYGGHLSIVEKEYGQTWARFIAIARDCHEQNVELIKNQQGFLLRVTRAIKISDELFVWIGTDLLSELEFPFLKPVNIKGYQSYHCHKCGFISPNPNPLKIHLFLNCDTSKLFPPTERPETYNISHHLSLNFSDTPGPFIGSARAQKINEAVAPLQFTSSHLPSSALYSTFPDKNVQNVYEFVTLNANINTSSQDLKLEFPQNSLNTFSKRWTPKSLSCSGPGHICAYCGKVYSRKYGLKIHVRTHTGYKPLKCKYCFRPFSDPSNLNKHVRLHTESGTPYSCTKCGKVLVRRRDLQRHLKSRHSMDSFNNVKQQNVLTTEKK
ncbi:zinc finger protein 91-like [Stegodyphus dumicola]|uniref:zinc finger protein 91-like n=1 Tax=Stegodyphus dumicola TaxID=202533 RepID=UPI0015AC78CC|nr:zinc finger protein 91-like [Stegodyphus dumicola]